MKAMLQDALVFNVTFENGTQYLGHVEDDPGKSITARMLYQLIPAPRPDWQSFLNKIMPRDLPTPSELATSMLTKMGRGRKSCALLLVDGAQKYADGANFEQRMKNIVGLLTNLAVEINGPLFICCLTATYISPIEKFFGSSGQKRIFIRLKPVDAVAVFKANPVLQNLLDIPLWKVMISLFMLLVHFPDCKEF